MTAAGSPKRFGNGVELVRERAMAQTVQRALERLYQIEDAPAVDAFLEPAGDGEREVLLVRHADDGAIELSLRIPQLADGDLDPLCQIIEGVSHFVYLAERARTNQQTTQLELEVQAEVDKYVVLAASLGVGGRVGVRESEALRERLYEDGIVFTGDAVERYRLANATAAKFVRRLEREYVASSRFGHMHAELRRFFRMGQEEKLRVARAA